MLGGGEGVKRNADQSVIWLQKAADQGYAPAITNLGFFYLEQSHFDQDYKLALDYFLRASNLGEDDAQLEAARLYTLGRGGIRKDIIQADAWLTVLSEEGMSPKDLGIPQLEAYFTNDDRRDVAQMVERFQMGIVQNLTPLAEKDDAKAAFDIARIYFKVNGHTRDVDKGVQWYRKAAELGQPMAEYILGQFYVAGKYLPQDLPTAAQWFTKSANQGNALSAYALGVLYLAGAGVDKDPVVATKWLKLAAKNGSSAALDMLRGNSVNGLGLAPEDTAVNLADLDVQPRAISQSRPTFPPRATLIGVEDVRVVVDFIVDKDGNVVNAYAIKCTFPGFGFEKSAVQAVKSWKFKAGIKGGRPVFTHMQVPIIYGPAT